MGCRLSADQPASFQSADEYWLHHTLSVQAVCASRLAREESVFDVWNYSPFGMYSILNKMKGILEK
jgi:hypothetical protein